jgi:hypothetical protein
MCGGVVDDQIWQCCKKPDTPVSSSGPLDFDSFRVKLRKELHLKI